MARGWKEIRVFVSSTFRDMQAERDHLVRFVFPRLREELLKHRLHLVDVDLRWGVTTDQQALDVCLTEIDQCRPRFIGLLGDRYGWVPPSASQSITAAEIEYGVLQKRDDPGFHYFYFRDPSSTAAIPASDADDYREPAASPSAAALVSLKHKIRAANLPVVEYSCVWDARARRFTGLEAFGAQVYSDLLNSVRAEFEAAPADALDEERGATDAFIESRTAHYVVGSRRPILDALRAHARADTAPNYVCVSGGPGTGKSALVSMFVKESADTDAITIANFVGASRASSNVRLLVQGLCRELIARANLTAEIPSEYEKLCDLLVDLLQRASKTRRVVLVIDAINQLDTTHNARNLRWLPARLPGNVRVVLSTIPGHDGEPLARLGARELTVPPLGRDDAVAIVSGFLKRYRKTLDATQQALLLAKRDAITPLYLTTALEELRTLGTYEEIQRRIEQLPDETVALFDWILARLERDPGFQDATGGPAGVDLVCGCASAIAAGRGGLALDDVVGLVDPGDRRGNVAALFRLLRPYLFARGELVDFFHGQLRAAAEARYMREPAARARVHQHLGAFFFSRLDQESADAHARRALSEVTHHYLEAGDPDGVAACVHAGIPARKTDLLDAGEEALAELRKAVRVTGTRRAAGWTDLLDAADAYCLLADRLARRVDVVEQLILEGEVAQAIARLDTEPDTERRNATSLAVIGLLEAEGYAAEAQSLWPANADAFDEKHHIHESEHQKRTSKLDWLQQVLAGTIVEELELRGFESSKVRGFKARPDRDASEPTMEPGQAKTRERSKPRTFEPSKPGALEPLLLYVYGVFADLQMLWMAVLVFIITVLSIAALWAHFVAGMAPGSAPKVYLAIFMPILLSPLLLLVAAQSISRRWVDSGPAGMERTLSRYLTWAHRARGRRRERRLRLVLNYVYVAGWKHGVITDRYVSVVTPIVLAHQRPRSVARWMVSIAPLGGLAVRDLLDAFRESGRADAAECLSEVERLPKTGDASGIAAVLVGLAALCTPQQDAGDLVRRFKASRFGGVHKRLTGGDDRLMAQTAACCVRDLPLRRLSQELLGRMAIRPSLIDRAGELLRALGRHGQDSLEGFAGADRLEMINTAGVTWSTTPGRLAFAMALIGGLTIFVVSDALTIMAAVWMWLYPALIAAVVFGCANALTRRQSAAVRYSEEENADEFGDATADACRNVLTDPALIARLRALASTIAATAHRPVLRAVKNSAVALSLRDGVDPREQPGPLARHPRRGFTIPPDLMIRIFAERWPPIVDVPLVQTLRRVPSWRWFPGTAAFVAELMTANNRNALRLLRHHPPSTADRPTDADRRADARQLGRALPWHPRWAQPVASTVLTLLAVAAALVLARSFLPATPGTTWLIAGAASAGFCFVALIAWTTRWGIGTNDGMLVIFRSIAFGSQSAAFRPSLLSALWFLAFWSPAFLITDVIGWAWLDPSQRKQLTQVLVLNWTVGLFALPFLVMGGIRAFEKRHASAKLAAFLKEGTWLPMLLWTAGFWTLFVSVIGTGAAAGPVIALSCLLSLTALAIWIYVAPTIIDLCRGSYVLYPRALMRLAMVVGAITVLGLTIGVITLASLAVLG